MLLNQSVVRHIQSGLIRFLMLVKAVGTSSRLSFGTRENTLHVSPPCFKLCSVLLNSHLSQSTLRQNHLFHRGKTSMPFVCLSMPKSLPVPIKLPLLQQPLFSSSQSLLHYSCILLSSQLNLS